jgi:hypothetical protein
MKLDFFLQTLQSIRKGNRKRDLDYIVSVFVVDGTALCATILCGGF